MLIVVDVIIQWNNEEKCAATHPCSFFNRGWVAALGYSLVISKIYIFMFSASNILSCTIIHILCQIFWEILVENLVKEIKVCGIDKNLNNIFSVAKKCDFFLMQFLELIMQSLKDKLYGTLLIKGCSFEWWCQICKISFL